VCERTVRLQDVNDFDRDELFRTAIQKMLREIERDSMAKKTDRLFQTCKPLKNFQPDSG
jgi:hypothetical protein